MTELNTVTPSPDDIDEPIDLASDRLDQQADAILLEDETRTFRPVHVAVREDAAAARDWSRARAVRLRRSIEDEPLRATLYALGIGVVIGLLAAR